MPGVTPTSAVQAFIAPLQQAFSCVAHGKISIRRGGSRPKVGQEQQWSLNDGGAAVLHKRPDFPLSGQLELYASEPYQKLGPPPASLQVTHTVARVSDKAQYVLARDRG